MCVCVDQRHYAELIGSSSSPLYSNILTSLLGTIPSKLFPHWELKVFALPWFCVSACVCVEGEQVIWGIFHFSSSLQGTATERNAPTMKRGCNNCMSWGAALKHGAVCVCVCALSVWVYAYQSPEPAFFTMDVPALDGGERHRVGVLQTQRERETEIERWNNTEIKMTDTYENNQNNTLHSLTNSIRPLTMERHSQQPQNHWARQLGGQLNRQPAHTHKRAQTRYWAGNEQRRREAGRGRRGWGRKPWMNPIWWTLFSFPLEKNGAMREEGRGEEEERRREGVPYPP